MRYYIDLQIEVDSFLENLDWVRWRNREKHIKKSLHRGPLDLNRNLHELSIGYNTSENIGYLSQLDKLTPF